MREVKYLSPSAISLYKQNKEDYYLRYLSDNRPEEVPQTPPMSVGSAFDAFAKSYLYEGLFGKNHNPKYDRVALFEAQVHPIRRDEAYKTGEIVFDAYKKSGALGDLMLELQGAIAPPRFEFDIMGVVNGYREGLTLQTNGVTFMGKPDVFFISKTGANIILDWKVNGYYSNYNTTPTKGYICLRDANGKNLGKHRDAMIMTVDGVKVNCGIYFEDVDSSWARQLTIYAWLLGVNVGEQFISMIHQICCKPDIRVAEHSVRTSANFQWKEFAFAQTLWEKTHVSDSSKFHYFDEVSIEESQLRCQSLDGVANALKGDGSTNDEWLRKVCR